MYGFDLLSIIRALRRSEKRSSPGQRDVDLRWKDLRRLVFERRDADLSGRPLDEYFRELFETDSSSTRLSFREIVIGMESPKEVQELKMSRRVSAWISICA